jgi:hypothetical protein
MTAGQRRWTQADQTRLEAALRLDAGENLALARSVARSERTCWASATGFRLPRESAQATTKS